MKYAILATGGKQYKVIVGAEVLVDKLNADKNKSYVFDQVLLIRDEDNILIGNPYIAGAKISGKVVDIVKGDKVTTSKFKAKVHYRRKIGFRHLYSKVMIEAISVNKRSAPQK